MPFSVEEQVMNFHMKHSTDRKVRKIVRVIRRKKNQLKKKISENACGEPVTGRPQRGRGSSGVTGSSSSESESHGGSNSNQIGGRANHGSREQNGNRKGGDNSGGSITNVGGSVTSGEATNQNGAPTTVAANSQQQGITATVNQNAPSTGQSAEVITASSGSGLSTTLNVPGSSAEPGSSATPGSSAESGSSAAPGPSTPIGSSQSSAEFDEPEDDDVKQMDNEIEDTSLFILNITLLSYTHHLFYYLAKGQSFNMTFGGKKYRKCGNLVPPAIKMKAYMDQKSKKIYSCFLLFI